MRAAVATLTGIAESLKSNVVLLTQMQQATRKRFENVETRVDKIDNAKPRTRNRPKR